MCCVNELLILSSALVRLSACYFLLNIPSNKWKVRKKQISPAISWAYLVPY